MFFFLYSRLSFRIMSNSNQNIADDLDNFDDIFHDYGDDADEKDDAEIDFLAYVTDPSKNTDNVDNPTEEIDFRFDTSTEQHLSQRLSQMAASTTEEDTRRKRPALTPTSPVTLMKKLKSDIADPLSSEEMPDYLLNDSRTFEQYMDESPSIEDLRQIAYLEHKTALIELHIAFWTAHLNSGTGQLLITESAAWQISKSSTRRIERSRFQRWSDKLKAIILADDQVKVPNNHVTYEMCFNYVTEKIRQLRTQLTKYRIELKQRKEQLNTHFTAAMDEKIKSFVEDYGMTLRRILIESKIVVIKCDYYDELFKSNFEYEGAYAHQVSHS